MDRFINNHDTIDDAASIAVSEISTTSTEMFEHEPFETLQTKVIELSKKMWPRLATDAFRVTRMEGGSYNRVLGIQVDSSKKQMSWILRHAQKLAQKVCPSSGRNSQLHEFVIRIPRYEHAWVEQEVAILSFLAGTKVPVPKIKFLSLSSDNPRIAFARELGSALAEMGKGIFKDVTYSLAHMDFEPRNILIDITSPGTAHLSAILDWDEAVFAPSFVNCRPPSWLWDFEGDEDLDEALANVAPTDSDLQAVKTAFEDAVGPENICRLAITGFHSNDDYEMAEKVIEEWNEMEPEHKVRGLFDGEDDDDN
ncbi:uncharacterized protein K460DRAFT_289421 [Cucurbitaria berberidis CBS 394.84]|uniref:Aminoglycoside phosphotransferase domain-containing protein n=1 Tax=Cucurbitaria berberidis CBS 394.84 TaxID=1168544 RepID=A0A9P4GCG3_9PLEO|nr:uncharacterized protein K460DRAFT_289421 [Cucurbitaria berberidis CBS 394.84]KAF1842801.1 hypothetical protein K460DRAFT_289421 [Cucurbitaria berberidis CBS 394.84]